ncbi:T9SS type A sorting domain-containing protein [Ignavibacterium album]|uniref:WD40/YVTN/BNR-like repeat-containing protein n=1 Tax=Ignavibacterium album TaxID=591197 RepID=UPI0035BB7BCE
MKIKSIIVFFLFLLLLSISFSYFSKNRIVFEKPPKTSGALEALQNWNYKRAYPGTDIPASKYYEAYIAKKNLRKISGVNYQWEQIGPHNIGGRTLDVEFNPQNPNTIFAGSASGGIWRSYTAGIGPTAWERIETGYPVLGVSSIAISPNDSNIIYIGTGEVYNYQLALGGEVIRTTRGSYGIGILKTTDYGQTWTKSLDWSYEQQRGVNDVEIDPNNDSIIWAATTEGIFKSTDAGSSWENVHPVIMGFDIAINPLNSNIVFATHGNLGSTGHGIYRTTDGGNTWIKLGSGLPATFNGKAVLSIYPPDPNIIYASIGNGSSSGAGTWLCQSMDGGNNWIIVNTTDYATYQGWYSHWVGVSPFNSNLVLAGGIDVFKSNNGGYTLTQKSYWYNWDFGVTPPGGPEGPPDYVHADQHSITFHPTNPNIIYFGTDGGVFRTTDAGETFSGCNGGYQSTQFYNGFSSSFNLPDLAIGGMQDNATAIYQGNVAWYRTIGGDGCQTAIDPYDDNILYGTYQYVNIVKSTDGGLNWIGIGPPDKDSPAFVGPFVVCRSNSNVIFAGSRKFHKSTNGGNSWTFGNGGAVLDGNQILSIGVSSTSTDTVYVATAPVNSRGRVFRSTDGGNTFINITGTLPDRYPDDIAVDPNDSKTLYIVFSGFGTSHLFKSTDAGDNWIDIGSSLPDVPSSAIAIDPNNSDILYFGNDLGVYVSTDAGQSWSDYSVGLPDECIVIDLSIVRATNRIRAVTHGNGVYEAPLFNPVSVDDKNNSIVEGFILEQNYPNPFNPSTKIKFSIPNVGSELAQTVLKVFDILGNEVATLVDEYREAGRYEVEFQSAVGNRQLASGIYFYKLQSGSFIETKKMILMR